MMQVKYIVCSVLLGFTFVLNAQTDSIQFSAELRPRIIVDNGYAAPKIKGDAIPVYTTQRTRLNALFSNRMFESYISFQDVRIWGADNNYKSSGVFGNTESISLHQAWVKLKIIESVSLKIGRQLFSYDDQRIISSRNWNDYQVAYDALLAEYKNENHRLHLALSYNASNKTDLLFPNEKFKTIDFIHYQYHMNKFTLSGIALVTGNTLTDTTEQVYYRGTYGMNFNYKTAKANAYLAAYYQQNLNTIGETTSAICFSVNAEYQLNEKIHLGLGCDYLSGNNENSLSTTNNRFDILYGRRHGWYGYMDYFSTTPQQGLQDYIAKLTYKPKKDVAIAFHYHYFMLAADKFDNTISSSKLSPKLGSEFDIKMNWNFNKIAVLEWGYSIYGTTNTLKQLKNLENEEISIPQFTYMMLIIKPSLWF